MVLQHYQYLQKTTFVKNVTKTLFYKKFHRKYKFFFLFPFLCCFSLYFIQRAFLIVKCPHVVLLFRWNQFNVFHNRKQTKNATMTLLQSASHIMERLFCLQAVPNMTAYNCLQKAARKIHSLQFRWAYNLFLANFRKTGRGKLLAFNLARLFSALHDI